MFSACFWQILHVVTYNLDLANGLAKLELSGCLGGSLEGWLVQFLHTRPINQNLSRITPNLLNIVTIKLPWINHLKFSIELAPRIPPTK